MNTFLKTIPILIIFIFLYSCQQKESSFAKIIKENKGKDIKLRNSNDTTIQYIYLETNPDALIGAYNKILMNDSILCIVDKEKQIQYISITIMENLNLKSNLSEEEQENMYF